MNIAEWLSKSESMASRIPKWMSLPPQERLQKENSIKDLHPKRIKKKVLQEIIKSPLLSTKFSERKIVDLKEAESTSPTKKKRRAHSICEEKSHGEAYFFQLPSIPSNKQKTPAEIKQKATALKMRVSIAVFDLPFLSKNN